MARTKQFARTNGGKTPRVMHVAAQETESTDTGFIDSQTLKEIQDCEEQIKQRVLTGKRISVQSIGEWTTRFVRCELDLTSVSICSGPDGVL